MHRSREACSRIEAIVRHVLSQRSTLSEDQMQQFHQKDKLSGFAASGQL